MKVALLNPPWRRSGHYGVRAGSRWPHFEKNGSRIHLFGIAYKKDVSDMRESPALDILQLLHRRGAELSYTDPYVPSLKEGAVCLRSVAEDAVSGVDCAVIATDHKAFNYANMPGRFPLVMDTRNALKGNAAKNIFRL